LDENLVSSHSEETFYFKRLRKYFPIFIRVELVTALNRFEAIFVPGKEVKWRG